jgi:hypothetical protein
MRVLTAMFALLTCPVLAADPIACPPSIHVTPQATVQPVPGWQPLPMAEHFVLRGARLFDGDPADLADLIPDRNDAAGMAWQLQPGMSYTFVCTYAGTEMTMAAKVPAGLKQCATSKKTLANSRPPNNTYIDASCR